jgi:hypothetical protein
VSPPASPPETKRRARQGIEPLSIFFDRRIQSRDLWVDLFLNHFGPDEPPQILVPYSLSK